MKTKLNKAYQVKLNTIVAKIKKRGVAPLSAESTTKLENVPPFAWPTKGAKTLPSEALPAETGTKIKSNPFIMRQPGPKSVTKASMAKCAKKSSRLATVYANILKGVPTWQVQGHPSPQYTTGNVPAHTVLTSGTAKVVKRGHSKPRALEAPYGKGKAPAMLNMCDLEHLMKSGMPVKEAVKLSTKKSKLFSPPAKDVELGKQVKALRKATKQSKG